MPTIKSSDYMQMLHEYNKTLGNFKKILYNNHMKRILIKISYDGSHYYGWQKQEGKATIQGEIEKALQILLMHPCEVFASGRTDAGVHALAQTAHFDMDINIPVSKLADVLNKLLPDDITIIEAKEVSPEFHARFSIKKKCYEYRVYTGKKKDPFIANYTSWLKEELDFQAIEEAKKLLIGKHNFKGFCSTATAVKDFNREIYSIEICKKKDYIYFTFVGNGFLYNMVRILVGTLIDIGLGKLQIENIKQALKTGDRQFAGITMPPNGLYLKWTQY